MTNRELGMSIKINAGFILTALISMLAVSHVTYAGFEQTYQNSANARSKNGVTYMRLRRYADAEREFAVAIKDFHWLKKRCRGLFKSCKIPDKKEFYRAFALHYTNRGMSRLLQGNYDGATSDANYALGMSKKNAMTYWLLGFIAHHNKDMSKVRRYYKKLLKMSPKLASLMQKNIPGL
jgi:Flp pilus assembly protein TadD